MGYIKAIKTTWHRTPDTWSQEFESTKNKTLILSNGEYKKLDKIITKTMTRDYSFVGNGALLSVSINKNATSLELK